MTLHSRTCHYDMRVNVCLTCSGKIDVLKPELVFLANSSPVGLSDAPGTPSTSESKLTKIEPTIITCGRVMHTGLQMKCKWGLRAAVRPWNYLEEADAPPAPSEYVSIPASLSARQRHISWKSMHHSLVLRCLETQRENTYFGTPRHFYKFRRHIEP